MKILGGIVSFCGDMIEPCELVAMRRAVSKKAECDCGKANVYGKVALFFEGEEQPLECGEEGKRLAIVFDGGISNRDELCRRLTLSYEECPADAGLAVTAYSLMTEGFFGAVSGSYHMAIYDEEQGRAIIAVRGRGRAPIYYIKEYGRLVFSTSLEAVLAFGEPARIRTLVDGDGFVISFGKCERVTIE